VAGQGDCWMGIWREHLSTRGFPPYLSLQDVWQGVQNLQFLVKAQGRSSWYNTLSSL